MEPPGSISYGVSQLFTHVYIYCSIVSHTCFTSVNKLAHKVDSGPDFFSFYRCQRNNV